MDTLCIFRCCAELYAVPAISVCEAIDECRPVPVPLAPSWVAGILAYRGDVLTIVSLRAVLGVGTAAAGTTAVLAMENPVSGERFGLAVDAVEDVVTGPQRADLTRLSPELLSPDSLQNENWELLSRHVEESHHAHAYCG